MLANLGFHRPSLESAGAPSPVIGASHTVFGLVSKHHFFRRSCRSESTGPAPPIPDTCKRACPGRVNPQPDTLHRAECEMSHTRRARQPLQVAGLRAPYVRNPTRDRSRMHYVYRNTFDQHTANTASLQSRRSRSDASRTPGKSLRSFRQFFSGTSSAHSPGNFQVLRTGSIGG